MEQLQSGHADFLDLATSYVCARLAAGKLLATVRARLHVRLRFASASAMQHQHEANCLANEMQR